jgi:phosphoserine phosphatase
MPAKSGRPLAIFDVCGTLFRDDTTLGFLFHLTKKHSPARWYLLNLWFHRRSPGFWLLSLVERLASRHVAKHLAVFQLYGFSQQLVEQEARIYVDFLVQTRVRTEIFPHFVKALEDSQTVLASASLEPVIRALAERFGVDYLASSLQIRDGRYTGKLLTDMTGRKLEELKRRFGPEWLERQRHCYTDNFSDLDLCNDCGQRTVVLLKPRHRRRWGSLAAHYVEVGPPR